MTKPKHFKHISRAIDKHGDRHITGYWEKKLPHLPGANSKQFWNIINGNRL